MDRTRRDRLVLAAVVWAVLVSQVLIYPGVADLVAALGGSGGLQAGMWFLVAEFAAFVTFAGPWGALSDALGRRGPLIVAGALGGAASYLAIAAAPGLDVSFGGVLALRALGGAATIGAFSLSITMLMDLSGGHGRNMGAAGIAIGLGAALGSVAGGRLATADPLWPLYGSAVLLVGIALVATTIRDRAPGRGSDATPTDSIPTGTSPTDAKSAGTNPTDAKSAGANPTDAKPADANAAPEADQDETGTGAGQGRESAGVGEVLSGLSDRPALLVPYAFGFVDRLTAGFFALVGVYYFRDVFDLSATGAGVVLALFFLPFAVLQYPLGVLSDRVGRFLPVVAGSICYGFVIAGVGLAPALPLAAGLMVLVGVCGALVAPATMALVTDVADPGERGAAMGGFNIFGSLGFLAGFLLGGLVADAVSYLAAFLVVGGTEVAIALLAFRAVRRIAPEGDADPRFSGA